MTGAFLPHLRMCERSLISVDQTFYSFSLPASKYLLVYTSHFSQAFSEVFHMINVTLKKPSTLAMFAIDTAQL